MKTGKRNLISDVPGVRVGHTTISSEDIQTGVSVVMPCPGSLFRSKLPAACHVINGFAKSTGLLQIEELGTLESPIAMTNTLSVGTVQQALVKYMLNEHPEIGTISGTVNVVVTECNDAYLNDIRACAITEQDVWQAIQNASEAFELGAVGAGRGMSCFEMKGGIGSASRIVELDKQAFTLGALVLANFGQKADFIHDRADFSQAQRQGREQGSIIIVLATDIPMESRQLKRLCRRMPAALARTGSYLGNGSGDVVIAFSTANPIPHFSTRAFRTMNVLHEDHMDEVFRAGIEACEEAVRSALNHAQTVIGRQGHIRRSLQDTLAQRK